MFSDEKEADQKPKKKKSREKWRQKLKKSVVLRQVAMPSTAEQSNPIKLIEQLKEFEAAIESNKRNEIYAKCLIGRNLVLLQKKKKKGAQFINFVRKHMTSYSRSMIYFLMKLYNVTQDYNRLMYVTLGIGELKTNFKQIEELVAEEPVYWKNLA